DGYVVGKNLLARDAKVLLVMVHKPPVTPDAVTMYERAKEAGVEIVSFEEDREEVYRWMSHCDVTVDAIYGTGFHGELDDTVKEIAALIVKSDTCTFAVDIPSGVEANTGRVAAGAVRANYTVTFDCYKPAHLLLES